MKAHATHGSSALSLVLSRQGGEDKQPKMSGQK
jgi:hypothetical protein